MATGWGGFAAYGLYPEYKDYYALHILLKDVELKDQVTEMLKDYVNIYKDEEIETRNVERIPQDYTPGASLSTCLNGTQTMQTYIIDLAMKINSTGAP